MIGWRPIETRPIDGSKIHVGAYTRIWPIRIPQPIGGLVWKSRTVHSYEHGMVPLFVLELDFPPTHWKRIY